MAAGDIKFMWRGKERTLNPYHIFFGTIFVLFISLVLGAVGALIYTNADGVGPSGVWGNALMILISCWIATMIMLNLGEPKADAKTMFWAGPVVFVAVHAAGALGVGLIWLFT